MDDVFKNTLQDNLEGTLSSNIGTVPVVAELPASVCCDVDATQSASYSGSGTTWSNLIASPNDGAAQADYNFTLISSPTFTGTPGDPAAYFNLSGSNYFNLSTALPPAIAKCARSDQAGTWMAIAFNIGGGTADAFYGNRRDATYNGVFVRQGAGATTVDAFFANGASALTGFNDAGTIANSTDYVIVYTWDGTGSTDNHKLYINSTTPTATNSASFPSNTTDSTSTFSIASCNAGAAIMAANTRIYGFYAGDEFLSDSQVANLYAFLEERHSRDYTP